MQTHAPIHSEALSRGFLGLEEVFAGGQALLEALERPEAAAVGRLYANLTALVEDLTPYWHFVEAAMVALEAKQWDMEATRLGRLCTGPCAPRRRLQEALRGCRGALHLAQDELLCG